MGLASKLAASSAPGGGAPGGYGAPQQQQAPGAYPPQLQPGQQRPGAPGGQGAYPGQGQQQYQAYPGKPGAPQYPGQLGSTPAPAPYSASSPQPRYGAQVPASQSYPTPPSVSPQPLYQQPQYGRPQSQPPASQSQYGGYQSPISYSQQYGAPQQNQPYAPPYPQQEQSRSPYPQNPGYGYQGQPGQYAAQQGYPPQGGQQYGGGHPPQQGYAQASPQQAAAYKQILQSCIQEKNLHSMYPPNSPRLDQIVGKLNQEVDQLCAQWRVPREVGQDIVKLALFDIILYIDDSGSMQFEENGERISDLKLILSRVAYAAALFDDSGVEVRFMNSDVQGLIRSEPEVEQLISRIGFKGLTPMGTSLKSKVLEPLVISKARAGRLEKPVLIITITDGQPAGEPQNAVFDAIRYAASELSRMPQYGVGACSYQFAQVGNDLKAREFLGKLDNEPDIGSLIDSTSNFEVEQDEMSRASPPVDLTPELWLTKLLLGAIDSSYDTKDEQSGRPAGQQSQYGAPQQGQYGAPPPGQYGGPGGRPPQGQPSFSQQQGYGAPPQGQSQYPPQQGYGRPPQQGYGQSPQQGGYPPQQGGAYSAPPPPPRY